MLRLSKKVEYGLLALQYMASKADTVVSAKEIAEQFDISFEFLAKTIQRLSKSGFIQSYQGVRGGYVLAREAQSITVIDVIEAIEGKPVIVECIDSGEDCGCQVSSKCTIKSPMHKIQDMIDTLLQSVTVADISESERTEIVPIQL